MDYNNELLNDIIEKFEDFLEEKGIDIPNEDKLDDPEASTIYGMDYGWLQGELREVLKAHGIECKDEWDH